MKLYSSYKFKQYHRTRHNNLKRHNDPLRRKKDGVVYIEEHGRDTFMVTHKMVRAD
jgi:hypothetical protein